MFPENRDFPGRFVPYFVDAQGVHCAVAHLIAKSGNSVLVERIARTRNNATVPALADEPGLAEWLAEHGLTLKEAASVWGVYELPEAGAVPEAARTRSGFHEKRGQWSMTLVASPIGVRRPLVPSASERAHTLGRRWWVCTLFCASGPAIQG